MLEETFTLEYVYSKDCFLYLSDKWFRKLNNSKFSALKLCCRKNEFFFTWGSRPMRLSDCTVGISATFAQGIDLRENDVVIIKAIEMVPPLQSVFMTPITQDDYDILDVSRDLVERSLLNQVQVIYAKEILTIWVSKSMHLKLQVGEIESKNCVGRLQPFTELVIANKNIERHVATTDNSSNINQKSKEPVANGVYQNNQKDSSIWKSFSEYLHKNVLGLNSNTTDKKNIDMEDDILSCTLNSPSYIFRVHPLLNTEHTKCCKDVHNPMIHPYNIFTHIEHLPDWCREIDSSDDSVPLLCNLSVINRKNKKSDKSSDSTLDSSSIGSDNEGKSHSNSSRILNSVCVRLYGISNKCKTLAVGSTRTGSVYVSSTIRQFLKLSVGSKVKLTLYKPELDYLLSEVYIKPIRTKPVQIMKGLVESTGKDWSVMQDGEDDGEGDNEVIKRFTTNLLEGNSRLMNNNAPFPLPDSEGNINHVQVVLQPQQLQCWPLTRAELQVCPVSILPRTNEIFEPFIDQYFCDNINAEEKTEHTQNNLKCYSEIFEEAVISLRLDLGLTSQCPPTKYNILITGKRGSGKTRIANDLCDYFNKSPYFVHIEKLDCKQLQSKTVDSLSKTLSNVLAECLYFQPSILLLDDLHAIAGVVNDSTDNSAKVSYYFRVADLLSKMLDSVKNSCISVVATSLSHTAVNGQLISARGCHAFTTILSVPSLNKDDRLLVLKEIFARNCKFVDAQGVLDGLATIAVKTEGYVERDLTSLVKKSIFIAMERRDATDSDCKCTISMDDIEKAMESTVPYDLINVSITRGSDCTWEAVGGLTGAKKILTEALIWPSKYAEVFNACPLRNERGVLLYGLPGTGKTLLAKAVAGECGFNFISVKGPELLSKYIGASEEAVRNIFQKAQNAKPCILFFDEFDSLAPRRGHDNTGVTDRVVNQLLTNLDGVECLEGVWVLASTSRPDLLDPALLRPGRIGTLVYCPLPDSAERLEILLKLSNKLRFTDDVDLKAVADQTKYFTAPDMKALLYAAVTMESNKHYIDNNKDSSEIYSSHVKKGDDSKNTLITQEQLMTALQVTKPYLQDLDRKRFLNIYEMFDARRTGARARVDIPGQQVTLA